MCLQLITPPAGAGAMAMVRRPRAAVFAFCPSQKAKSKLGCKKGVLGFNI
jgi:hypothetical protein